MQLPLQHWSESEILQLAPNQSSANPEVSHTSLFNLCADTNNIDRGGWMLTATKRKATAEAADGDQPTGGDEAFNRRTAVETIV